MSVSCPRTLQQAEEVGNWTHDPLIDILPPIQWVKAAAGLLRIYLAFSAFQNLFNVVLMMLKVNICFFGTKIGTGWLCWCTLVLLYPATGPWRAWCWTPAGLRWGTLWYGHQFIIGSANACTHLLSINFLAFVCDLWGFCTTFSDEENRFPFGFKFCEQLKDLSSSFEPSYERKLALCCRTTTMGCRI